MTDDLGNLSDNDFKRLVHLVNEIIHLSHEGAREGQARAHEIYALSRDARDILILDETSREAMRRLTNTERPTMYGVTISKSVEDYVRAGMKINAIKELRTETALGLKEAKDVVEAFASTITPF
jgi:ribosomal protein L7/L12